MGCNHANTNVLKIGTDSREKLNENLIYSVVKNIFNKNDLVSY